ncbi:MAG: ABC transporter substrate-binding protein [Spirochaetales bacterium]|nr:ABC transporter substrate-binding protein [Spirochaetales bacterium]
MYKETTTKRRISPFCALAALSLALAAPASALGARELAASEPIVIRAAVLKGPSGVSLVRLLDGPALLPSNATMETLIVPNTDVMVAKLLAGDLDVAVLPPNLAVNLFNSGMDFRLGAVVGFGMNSVVSADPSVSSIRDLTGRTVQVAGQGATPEFVLRTLLAKEGLVPGTDLTLAFSMPVPEIASSLVAGRIPLAVLPEPFATQALAGNPSLSRAFTLEPAWREATGYGDYPMTVLVVRGELVDSRPDAVSALLDACKASVDFVVADPVAAGLLVERRELGLKAAIATKAIPSSNYRYLAPGAARPALEALLRVFLEYAPDSIGGKLPAEGFWRGDAREK